MTPAEIATFATHIAANTNQIGGVPINELPHTNFNAVLIAEWYNTVASPDYWGWKHVVSRADVYHALSPSGTVWDWNAYKGQSQSEQGAWTQMFMGDAAPMTNLNFRNGCFNIFSGSAPQNAQRAHIFACGRRLLTRVEKVYASAPQSAGGITVGANNGNTTGDVLGATTNPAVFSFEGPATGDDVQAAWS